MNAHISDEIGMLRITVELIASQILVDDENKWDN